MRITLTALLVLLWASHVTAQETPRVELFSGYSYANVEPASKTDRAGLNGWNSNLAVNLFSAVGLVADFSGHYGKIGGSNTSVHTALFGPRFSYHGKRVSAYVHSLYGVSRISANGSALVSLIGKPSDSGFAFVPGGGGVEIRLSEKIACRLFEIDLMYTNWGQKDGQESLRFSTGIVFRFRKK